MIINLGCASVDNHIPRDDIFDYHHIRECNIYIILTFYNLQRIQSLNNVSSLMGFCLEWCNVNMGLTTPENLTLIYANNKGADHTAHLCSLISAFVIHFLESMIVNFALCKILIF